MMADAASWRSAAALHTAALLLSLAASAAPAAPLVSGLDHIPLAVNNLEQAIGDFEKLGFVLKPGRHHDNGIRNAHVKFANGTEIELITAPAARDALSAEYVAWLKHGDGPAFWSVYSADLPALTRRLAALGLAPHNDGEIVTFAQAAFPHQLFFADRAKSPTDKPAYFLHPNTAYRLAGLWLTRDPAEQRLVRSLGAAPQTNGGCAPFAETTVSLTLPESDAVHFVPPPPGQAPGRSIIGATLMVHSLATARQVLLHNQIHIVPGCPPGALWVTPSEAHGLWIELVQ